MKGKQPVNNLNRKAEIIKQEGYITTDWYTYGVV